MKKRKPVFEVDLRIRFALSLGLVLKLLPVVIALIRAIRIVIPQLRP